MMATMGTRSTMGGRAEGCSRQRGGWRSRVPAGVVALQTAGRREVGGYTGEDAWATGVVAPRPAGVVALQTAGRR
jgi:hypothetical protein